MYALTFFVASRGILRLHFKLILLSDIIFTNGKNF
jgi:hypothetical protein